MNRRLGAFAALIIGVAVLAGLLSLRLTPPDVPPSNPAHTAAVTPTKMVDVTRPAVSEKTSPGKSHTPATIWPYGPPFDPNGLVPYPDATLCVDTGAVHDNSRFHALWDGEHSCHYDHEHGQNPFTSEVTAAFPDFDLRTLLGGVGVGHTNPSSPMENTHKHGGFKWDVTLSHSSGCAGREGVPTGVDALVVQYHAFGNYSIEFEARIHSAAGLLRQCREDAPGDYGYVFVNQHQDYGQRVAPYQGQALPYPDTPLPAYDPAREPYFSTDCFGDTPPCDKYPSLEFVLTRHPPIDSTWISEPANLSASGSRLFALLFRVRDTYQILDWNDQAHPFTFLWICSDDGGIHYSPVRGCGNNNSTTRVNEVIGEIPAEWDNLTGFDMDARLGRITAEGFVTRFGDLNPDCTAPGPDCHPIKLAQAFIGRYGTSFLLSSVRSSFDPLNLPERDVYFCGMQVCAEDDPGAMPSGWIGPEN